MTITLAEFGTKYNGGPPMRSPYGLGGECEDLVVAYAGEVLGDKTANPFTGNAVDMFGQRSAPGGYKWIRNDPNNLSQIPPRGAIMVWGESKAIGTGPLGHVDIVLDAVATYFNGFDQNWPLGAGPRIIRHSYVGIIGWGYPQIWDYKPLPIIPQTPVETPPPATAAYTFRSDAPIVTPLPADGTMTFDQATTLADRWAKANGGGTIYVNDVNGNAVYVYPLR